MSKHLLPLAFGLAAALTGVAQAQDYSAGKTPAQLFASDCSACHKTPQGLAKGTDARSLANFLREHYTTKPESAGALAAFVAGAGTPAAADGKPKPGAAREKPEPAAASGKPRRPEPAGEGDQAARPAPKPRSAAVGSEPKPGEEQKPAQRRQPATPRTAHPGDGAKPEVDDGAKPAASAEPKPGTRTRAAKPPVTAKRDGEKPAPAQAARPDSKLESYISSGESAKPMESEAAVDSDRRLHSYATSGGGVGAITGEPAKPAASPDATRQSSAPQVEPAPTDAAKPATTAAEESKPAAPVAAAPRNRPRRAAAPVGGDTEHQ